MNQNEASHEYEVEKAPGNKDSWRVIKKPLYGGGGMVLAEYTSETIAATLAGVLNNFIDFERS
ncbi:hypothetical protein ACFRCI_17315 [Streptomyces sp. NPDC056638]|uniref:hypothetical protein n=1 Tax=Streptomyces sp. NPDC056638 TaxID=3345887 RepID=UPI0036746097